MNLCPKRVCYMYSRLNMSGQPIQISTFPTPDQKSSELFQNCTLSTSLREQHKRKLRLALLVDEEAGMSCDSLVSAY